MHHGIYFANPHGLYLLFLSFVIAALFWYSLSERKKSLSNFAHQDSLKNILFLQKRTYLRYGLLLGVWAMATLALMQPQKTIYKNLDFKSDNEVLEEKSVENTTNEKLIVQRRACDVIFLLDASASMEVSDTRTKQTRLEYAKEIIDQTISQLDGQNVALYAFTSQLSPVVPPTLDYLFTRLMLKNIQINEGDVAGTDLFEALEGVYKKHFIKHSQKQKALVLLTDGGETQLSDLNDQEKQSQISSLLNQLKKKKNIEFKVFSIGLGSKQGQVIPGINYNDQPVISSLDENLLETISRVQEGQYFFANNYSAYSMGKEIAENIRKDNQMIDEEISPSMMLLRKVILDSNQSEETKSYFQWPLLLALICLTIELIMPFLPIKKEVEA